MDTGPMAGLAATIIVPSAATPRAAAPIFSVMLSVVFGLITLIFMTPGLSAPACRTRPGGRPVSSVSDRGSAGLRSPAGGGHQVDRVLDAPGLERGEQGPMLVVGAARRARSFVDRDDQRRACHELAQ